MAKVWLIAEHHFLQEVRKRSFILVLLALPLFLGVTIGTGYLAARLDEKNITLGYVDPAGMMADPAAGPEASNVHLVPFETAGAAHQALESGKIDAYYLLPATAGARRAQLIYFEPPPYDATSYFKNLVRRNLMADQPPALVERAVSGADVTVRATDRNREFPGGDPSASHFLPLIAATIFAFLVMTTFGYMAEAVVVEKENRTMEIIVSSVSPGRLMTGKIVGALGIALIQLAVWVACLLLAVWLGGTVLQIDWLADIQPNWRDLAIIVIVALPSYLFLAALTTAIGSVLVETQEAHQLGGFSFVIIFLPIYLLVPLTTAPNSPLALGLSFFPLTSVVTIALRSLVVEVPTWQIGISVAIACASGILMVWLAGRAFQTSLLRYGQRLNWRDLFRRRLASDPADLSRPEATRSV